MKRRAQSADLLVAALLQGGALLGAALIALGAALFFITGAAGAAAPALFPHTLGSALAGAGQLYPPALMMLGLMVLLAAPVAQVCASALGFWREGDALYAGIAALVLAILLLSIFAVGSAFARPGPLPVHDASPAFFCMMFGGSAVAGFVGSLAGIGGGLFIVPLLTLGFGVPFELAVGASIVSVIATSTGSAAAYVRARLVNRRLGTLLEVATTAGAVCGALLTAVVLHTGALFIIFGLALAAAAVPLFTERSQEEPAGVKNSAAAAALRLPGAYPDPRTGAPRPYRVTRVWAGLGMMYGAGLLSGLLGIGSGVFKVLAMDTAMRLPARVSVTTSEFMIGVTAAASAGIYLLRGDNDPVMAAPMALGELAGAAAGARVLPRLSNASLRRLFIPVVALAALSMLARGLGGL